MKKNRKRTRPPAKQRPQTIRKAVTAAPPLSLTPTLCKRLQHELVAACTKVAEQHGLTLEGGELDNIDLRHSFDICFRIGIPLNDGSLYSPEKAMFEAFAEYVGLEPSDYARTFRTGGETFRITGVNLNRPKYPISAIRIADGKSFKFTPENIAMYLQHSGS